MIQSTEERFVGTWRTDAADTKAQRAFGDVSMTFTERGELVYTVHSPKGQQIINLTYRVEGNWVVTDQRSAPREERTRFSFNDDGHLVFGGEPGGEGMIMVRQRGSASLTTSPR